MVLSPTQNKQRSSLLPFPLIHRNQVNIQNDAQPPITNPWPKYFTKRCPWWVDFQGQWFNIRNCPGSLTFLGLSSKFPVWYHLPNQRTTPSDWCCLLLMRLVLTSNWSFSPSIPGPFRGQGTFKHIQYLSTQFSIATTSHDILSHHQTHRGWQLLMTLPISLSLLESSGHSLVPLRRKGNVHNPVTFTGHGLSHQVLEVSQCHLVSRGELWNLILENIGTNRLFSCSFGASCRLSGHHSDFQVRSSHFCQFPSTFGQTQPEPTNHDPNSKCPPVPKPSPMTWEIRNSNGLARVSQLWKFHETP